MSNLSDAETSRQGTRSRAFLLGLYAGLSVLLLLVASVHCVQDSPGHVPQSPLHKATNIYALQALAGAALGLWRVRRRAARPWATPAIASVWLCSGLALWVVGQAGWTWAAFRAAAADPGVGWYDIFYIASDVVWLVAMLKIFQSLNRRGLTEIRPFMPVMAAALVLLVGAYIAWYLIKHADSAPETLKFFRNLIHILLTFGSTILAAALVMGHNAEIPRPVQQCLQWLCWAAAVNTVGILAYTVTEERHDALAYYDGNWVDWLFLTAMLFWGLAALKWPVREEELQYTFGTTRSGVREADVYQAGEIARSYCGDADELGRVTRYVDSIRWVLDTMPGCWRVVKLGDQVVGSTFLFPVPRDLMKAVCSGQLKEGEMFESVRENPISWECLYLADASILTGHRKRGLAFKAFKATIENIAKEYPQIEVYCCPNGLIRQKLSEKLQAHLKEQHIIVKMIE